jgi:MFS family permease
MRTKKLNKIYILSFLFTLHMSISAYVNSTFLSNIISEKYVGIIFTASAVMTLFLLSESAQLLKYFGNKTTSLWFVLFNMLSLVGLINYTEAWIVILSFIVFSTTNSLVLLSLDIFIEHFSDEKSLGKTRALYLTIISLAWMISPLITSNLITREEGGYIAVYKIAFGIVLFMAIGLVFSVKHFQDKTYEKTAFLKTYQFLKKNKHVLAITMLNFLLLYTPIYLLNHVGLGWSDIGVIFTIMLMPFVLFSLPLGFIIDKYHIRKSTLIAVGFSILIISTFFVSFITTTSVCIWAIVLFTTRTGATIIETSSEIYFFAHVKEEDAHLLSTFRDMVPVSLVIAPVIATSFFLLFPFKYIFAFLAVIMLTGFYYIPHLRHHHVGLNQNK